MSASRYTEKTIFLEAVEIASPAERAAFLERSCGDDRQLRAAVEELLLSHQRQQGVLDITAVPLAERPGVQIGPYKLLQQIGEGGMGTVYMAEQIQPVQRKVALKVIKAGMDSHQVIARFEAERQALAMMDHVNIARVLDAGATESGRPYFVMEIVHGVPITKYCDDNHLTPRQRLELFVPVCQAIQHAHQKGIIHRDIKPSNVMVTLYDGQPVPKVIDFGVAKATEQKLTERTLFTQYGTMVGTLEYMSPEQAEMSALGVDTRSDIYSLGVLLYELLTGSTPLSNKRMKEAAYAEILRMIKEEEPPKPSTRLSDSGEALASISAQRHTEPTKLTKLVRGELDWIVMKTLEKDRARRYETANSLAQDVQRYLADEPVEACPPSVGYRLRKLLRKRKKAVVTTVGFALLLVVGAMVSTWQAIRATQAEHIAIEALDEEEQARAAETKQRRVAEESERKALDALNASARNLYHASISLAHREWYANQVDRAEAILDACPNSLRGWEWRYLKRLCQSELITIRQKSGANCVAFSPDGRQLAVGGWTNAVEVWDGTTGAALLSLPMSDGVSDGVHSIAFSQDGRRLAAGSGKYGTEEKPIPGEVKVWDAQSGAEVFTLRGHERVVLSVAFSPDGRLLATGSIGSVKVWDAVAGKELLTIDRPSAFVEGLTFSPDGTRLAGADRDSSVRLWDPKTGKELAILRGHSRMVGGVAFSPDGRWLASASDDHTVKVWNVPSGKELLTFRGHTNNVNTVTFSPDGRIIASGGRDGLLKVWEAATGQLLRDIRGHSNSIEGVAFSANGRLASADVAGTVKVWDPQMGQEALSLGHGGASATAFSPDGKRVASTSYWGSFVLIWDAEAGVAVRVLHGDQDFGFSSHAVAFSPDGNWLAAGYNDGTVLVWDAERGEKLFTLKGHKDNVNSVAFAPDGKTLASVSQDGTLRLWGLAARREVRTIRGPSRSVAFSPDGHRILSDGPKDRVLVWDAATGKELLSLAGHLPHFALESAIAAATGNELLTQEHAGDVYCVAFSPDGRLLASAGMDLTVRVWDAHTGGVLATLSGHAQLATTLAFSPDSGRLVSAAGDMTVRVWETKTWQPVITLQGHTDRVDSIAFSRDGHRIASASFDGTVRIWDAAPLTSDLRDTREAGRVVRFQLDRVASREELAEAIRRDRSLSEEVRRRAVVLTAAATEDPNRPNEASWSVVRTPGSAQPAYLMALRQAEWACELDPDNADFLGTLGTARYRTGDWKGAVAALEKSIAQRRRPDDPIKPAEGFVLTMAKWQLGEKVKAREWFDKSVAVMDKDLPNDEELRTFRAEAAALLGELNTP